MEYWKGLARGFCFLCTSAFAGVILTEGDKGAPCFLLGCLIGGSAMFGWWQDER